MPTDGYNAAVVERVRSFVNTYAISDEGAEEKLGSSAELVDWLEGQDLLDDVAPGRPEASSADLDLARDLRSTLRQLLQHDDAGSGGAPNDFGPGSEARRRVDRLSERLPLRVELCSDGQPYLVPAVGGVRHGLARILAAVAALSPDDWSRLKICPADDCQWVFYDTSRNRSRRWCSMESCGNRSKIKAYRGRR